MPVLSAPGGMQLQRLSPSWAVNGRAFHAHTAAAGNARSPRVDDALTGH